MTINIMKHLLSIFSAFFLAIVMLVGNVFAQVTPYTLFGTSGYIESDYQEDMAVQITSGENSYGGIDFVVADDTRFADITHLSTDFSVIHGTCGGGSPRFQIGVNDPITNTEKILYVYIGQDPLYSCEPDGWQQSGNLLSEGKFIDATQLGSLFYTSYEEALMHYGGYEVMSLELVVDSGWMFGNQSIAIDNIQINDDVFDFKTI
jgi:hypothetical protein